MTIREVAEFLVLFLIENIDMHIFYNINAPSIITTESSVNTRAHECCSGSVADKSHWNRGAVGDLEQLQGEQEI